MPGAGEKVSRRVFARDAAGRVGWSWFGRGAASEITGLRVVLADTAPRAGRVTAGGQPVAGAEVVPLWYSVEGRGRRSANAPASSIELPEWEHTRPAACGVIPPVACRPSPLF